MTCSPRRAPRRRREPGSPGSTADGGLAYWMDDVQGARASYEERLALAETTGDPMLIADAHYDLGFTVDDRGRSRDAPRE